MQQIEQNAAPNDFKPIQQYLHQNSPFKPIKRGRSNGLSVSLVNKFTWQIIPGTWKALSARPDNGILPRLSAAFDTKFQNLRQEDLGFFANHFQTHLIDVRDNKVLENEAESEQLLS